MIAIKVLKILGSIFLILCTVLYYYFIIEKVREKEQEKFGMYTSAGADFGFCFLLLVFAGILLASAF